MVYVYLWCVFPICGRVYFLKKSIYYFSKRWPSGGFNAVGLCSAHVRLCLCSSDVIKCFFFLAQRLLLISTQAARVWLPQELTAP